jgi:tRNA (cmo5U34)-methyltransferase
MSRSIDAYDLPQRVATYDSDMELMHPNRSKMVRIALEVLPYPPDKELWALDLGIGTGYFTHSFLRHYSKGCVVGLDGAAAMVELAKTRLGDLSDRVEYRIGDFRGLRQLVADGEMFDVVYSSYALHHLSPTDKEKLVRECLHLLRPEGWFVNADILVAETERVERRLQELRVDGILQRARGKDARFETERSIREFLDALESRDGDQPQTLADDLNILKRAGVRGASVFWLEYREAVYGGQK